MATALGIVPPTIGIGEEQWQRSAKAGPADDWDNAGSEPPLANDRS